MDWVNGEQNSWCCNSTTIYHLAFTIYHFSGQTPDLPATHARLVTVAPFPAWRGSPAPRCAEPGI